MILRNAPSAVKAPTLKTHDKLASWVFIFCTLLMLASVVHMWSHWLEIWAVLGFDRAAGADYGYSIQDQHDEIHTFKVASVEPATAPSPFLTGPYQAKVSRRSQIVPRV